MNVVMDPHCKGCAYLGYAGGGYTCCDYLFKENRRRPCPPGKDCTVKITPKQKEMLDKQRKKESKRVVMGACQWCGAEFIQVSNGSKKYCGKNAVMLPMLRKSASAKKLPGRRLRKRR